MSQNDRPREAARDVPVAPRRDVVVVGGGPAGHRRGGLRGAQRRERDAARTLPLSRRAGRRAAWCWCSTTCTTAPRSPCAASPWRSSSAWSDGASPSRRPRRTTAPVDQTPPRPHGASGRAGALFDFHTHTHAAPDRLCRRLRPRRLQARRLRHDRRSRREAAAAQLVLLAPSSRTAGSRGVVVETKEGRQAILGDVVIDATGDLDVAASAGAHLHRRRLSS